MPMLTKNDIRAAAYLGLIEIDDLTELNATSLDIRIEQLLTPAMDIEDMKPVPLINGEYWIVKPGDFFLYQTIERFNLAPYFHGQINSRSSWARYGVASREADDNFTFPSHNGFEGSVICRLNTLGTTVKIRPGDAIAQAHLAYNRFEPVSDRHLAQLIEYGRLEITRRGKNIKKLIQPYMIDGNVYLGNRLGPHAMNGGFTLTHDPIIKIYTGKTIDPHNHDPECFYEKRLATRGSKIKQGTFFISASAESVKIDRHFVGWVGEWNHLFRISGEKGPDIHPDERHSSLQTHAAAPKIDPYPRFHGKITFENYANQNLTVRPGQRISELYLYMLNNPYFSEEEEVSRYKGQNQATGSKGHFDKKYEQLALPFENTEK
ncbi:2'-deoxycytidine 5'-triphosphate deaminase [Candidatus Woesearchaeota archaeon]|nr:2'-deoxycytidine 5'-triphosphate deaminase [Candidatus Woesearchaeota archaeon]